MVSKTFNYRVFDIDSVNLSCVGEKKFSLNIADKAKYIVHKLVKNFTINNAQYTSATKTKSEVNGGGRKPWKQKGTGRARAGSTRSPLWRGGGVIFGPKPKKIYKKVNKKEKQLALRTILYNKQNEFRVFNNFENLKTKTNEIVKKLKILDLNEKHLVISSKPNKNLKLSIQNLKNCEYILANQLNINALLKAKQIIIDEIAFKVIEENYGEY
jgi:large subunit ribosomal protein L4